MLALFPQAPCPVQVVWGRKHPSSGKKSGPTRSVEPFTEPTTPGGAGLSLVEPNQETQPGTDLDFSFSALAPRPSLKGGYALDPEHLAFEELTWRNTSTPKPVVVVPVRWVVVIAVGGADVTCTCASAQARCKCVPIVVPTAPAQNLVGLSPRCGG